MKHIFTKLERASLRQKILVLFASSIIFGALICVILQLDFGLGLLDGTVIGI
ncbi:MAG TPA: hypothetical protein VLA72_18190 [Anaerolineales bacterium]|nr:hypothetical protein [Anaerolineales bacterium]